MLGKGRLCKGGEKEEGSRVGNKVIIGMLYKMKLPLITRHFAYLKDVKVFSVFLLDFGTVPTV